MNWKRIDPNTVDLSILERITEADVVAWMTAKLAQLRATTDPTAHRLDLEAHYRNYYGGREEYFDFSASVGVQCGRGYSEPSVDAALVVARLEQLKNPDEKARKAREKARHLNEEAAELEQLAATAKQGGIKP